jgi:hypothetical protein
MGGGSRQEGMFLKFSGALVSWPYAFHFLLPARPLPGT